MKSTIASLLIGLVTTTVFAGEVKKYPDPDCPLTYFFRGYDYVMGNPAANEDDPGWRASLMHEQRLEDCLYCSYSETCERNYEVFEMEGELDYYERLYGKAKVHKDSEDFLKSVAFTGSGEFEYQRQDVFGAGLVNIQAEGFCQIFDGGRLPNCYEVTFNSSFLNTLEDFPTSTDSPEWFDQVHSFFLNFGTHIIKTASLGARWSYESQFTQASYEAMRSSDVNINMAAEASAEHFRTAGGSAEFESEQQKEFRLMFDGSTEKQRSITVGALPPTDISFGEWANNIDNPIPQSYELSPISELLTPRMFPDDPDIELKRVVMEAGYELYCDSVPGCREPIIVRVSATEEGKYQTQNVASVACPVDYQLISGGCQTEPAPSEPFFWMMASLEPIKNSYQCIANMDYPLTPANSNYYRGLTVNATCLHDSYIEDLLVVSCEGQVGQLSSECVAYCPNGYKVTGGGCSSTSAAEARPWKITISNPLINDDSRQGWNCRVSEDAHSLTYNEVAQGHAICVEYTEGAVADHKIVTETSGTAGQWTNGAVAVCDVGYELLGGGCKMPSYNNAPYNEWKIVETQPSMDSNKLGWSCVGQEDIETLVYYQDVQTNALCVKLN